MLELAGSVALYGAERWILALVKHLNRDRIKPMIGALADDNGLSAPLCDASQKMGIPSISIKAPGRFNYNAIRLIRRVIAENNIDIIHTHGYKGDILGLLATRGSSCRIITTPHGWTHEPDFKLRLYELFDKALYPFMDSVVPLSKDMFRQLAGKRGMARKMRLIENAVDLDEIYADKCPSPEIIFQGKNKCFIIGFIGRLIKAKGLTSLLSALSRMSDRSVSLALIGNGPEEEELRRLARELNIGDRVRFFGYREDRIALMKSFDVFVLPSLSEGIPRCLMEAMGIGVPIVATDIPGCRDLIENGKTGLLFPPGDVDALCDALESLKNSGDKRNILANNAKDYVYKHYSANRMAREYEDLFCQMIKDKGVGHRTLDPLHINCQID